MIRLRLKAANGTVLTEKLVSQFPVLLGRNATNGILVEDSGVSSKHAEIDWDGGRLHLRDMGSRNGTFVGEKSVREVVLNLPCAFRLGSHVSVEAELATSATSSFDIAPAQHRVPTVFRPTLPQPAPVVVDALPAPEQEMGEERYWHELCKLSPRTAAGGAIALTSALFLFHFAVFRESVLESFMVAAVALFGSVVLGGITAALFALPGALLRGEYSFKPLFLQSVAAYLLVMIDLSLRPAFLYEYAGYGVRLLCLPIVVVLCLSGPYVFLFTTFPHKHARRLFVVSAMISMVALGLEGYSILTVSRRTLLHSAFVGDFHASRGLAGRSAPVSSITGDLRAFGFKHPVQYKLPPLSGGS